MPRLSFSAGTLLLEGISRDAVAQVFGSMPWIWDPRAAVWRCDAMEYAAAARCVEKVAWIEDTVPAWHPVRWPNVNLPSLRPEQQAAVAAWTAAGRGCIVMPTGTGKTEVALSIMAQTAVSTLVVAPVRDLMYQWHRRILAGLGYDAGIIGDNVHRVRAVSATTYDSACIHMEKFGNQFGLLIFDECHHLPGDVRRDAARMSAAPMRMGLTATIDTGKGKGEWLRLPERSEGCLAQTQTVPVPFSRSRDRHADLESLIGPVVYDMPIAAVRGKTLADYEVVKIPVHLSDEEQAQYDRLSREVRSYMINRRKTDPHFDWEDLCAETGKTPEARRALKAYLSKKSIEDRAEEKLRVLEDLFRLHSGEPCIVFAGSNAMARDVSRRFLIPCLLHHCGKKERLDILHGLESGTYPALVANQVLDEGVDLPEVKVAMVIGGTASSRQAKQRLGRILRKSGNARAVLYEIVCADTGEAQRSRHRRASDAYEGTRHRRRK